MNEIILTIGGARDLGLFMVPPFLVLGCMRAYLPVGEDRGSKR